MSHVCFVSFFVCWIVNLVLVHVQTLVHAYSCTHAAFDLVALFQRFSSNLISVLLTGSAVTVLTFLAHDFGPHILQVSA